jgi:hypothetical protein
MILGMTLATFTLVHVLISLVGIAAGIVVLLRMLLRRGLDIWNLVFLVTTVATSATGFLFPSKVFGPPHIVGVISLVVLAVALVALYAGHLAGVWRWIYAVTAIFALYLNVFVLVVQLFDKIAALHKFAPTGAEPPFAVAQGAVILLFAMLGTLAVKRFQPMSQGY